MFFVFARLHSIGLFWLDSFLHVPTPRETDKHPRATPMIDSEIDSQVSRYLER